MNILTRLSCELDSSEQDVLRVIASAPIKYKVYTIPKRTQGRRTIAHPAKELKTLQRAFINLYRFPIHSNAMAYRKGLSIRDNASFHKDNQYLLKMDFENFFNSITPEIFWNAWKQHWLEVEKLDQRLIENILFWAPDESKRHNLVLSVGAPSSPSISNFCMYNFDHILTKYCIENNIFVTRYADDLTFSTNTKDILFTIPKIVSQILKSLFGKKITINNQKTIFTSKAHNKHVTGITITPNGELSIGRDRKRYIKHLVHQFTLDNLNDSDINHLKGLLSFSQHIEPSFIDSLKRKYSERIVKNIIRGNDEKSQ